MPHNRSRLAMLHDGTVPPDVRAQVQKSINESRKTHDDHRRFCGNCHFHSGDDGRRLLKCSGCQTSWYCNKECQRAHWKTHKAECLRVKAELLSLPDRQKQLMDAFRNWTAAHKPIMIHAGNNTLLPNRDRPDVYRIDTHVLFIDLEETYPGSAELKVQNAYIKDREVIRDLVDDLGMQDSFGETLNTRAREIPHLEKSLGSKVVGTMYILVHCEGIHSLHPIVVTEKSLGDSRKNMHDEQWLEVLKENTLPGKRQYVSRDGIFTATELGR
ncbi:hypothetical protein FRC02_010234 [Tulasnella sp. 418]|nr:hypothetical protein FRC02_010234 [Tulasnella sp. 418]